ncbi:hypothetical protein [uncultured phage_MedDCM-OCT-S45-C4]|uniref:Uncharacterized protein n=1 Tax=uncultured phage_MedDCM-OCT-S45-C4 TaxID=2740801 RepID=A0A6S4PL48_9CAUD|nr:hypothetical protein HOQ58_gp03 [uncultured phage_MedDCM-OCT-S45-C4]BAQ93944.1 hypothetical protein [uncultured phage_MedDCM-OCT-S45-C4]
MQNQNQDQLAVGLRSPRLHEYCVTLSNGENMYILAANSEEAAWDALELSIDRTVTLVNVFRTHEW